MAVRMRSALVAVALCAAVAHAEGVESRQRLADTPGRLHGVTTLQAMPGGGYLTLGGSTLRMLKQGSRSPEVLHRQPRDNLYRVAASEAGEVLAVWETDPRVHYFVPSAKRHLTFLKPQPPSPDVRSFQVAYLAFLPGGRHALVHMEGNRKVPDGRRTLELGVDVTYRVALDGTGAAEVLSLVEGARRLAMTRDAALYVMPRDPGRQRCTYDACSPVAEVFAVELIPRGVRRTVLVDGARTPLHNAKMVWGTGDDLFVMLLESGVRERQVLRWRPGAAGPDVRPFPSRASPDEKLRALKNGDVLQLQLVPMEQLSIRRHRPDGSEQAFTLLASQHPDEFEQSLFGMGERADGRVWMHWGDHLLLFSRDMSRTPSAFPLEPLLARRDDWAGVSIYQADPELLWVGVDLDRGRDFVRLTFDEVERRAKPWAPFRDEEQASSTR